MTLLFSPDKLDSYPLEAGVYIMKNAKGSVIYVGKANSLKKRLKQYFVPGRDSRPTIPLLLSELSNIETVVVQTEKEALLLENMLIKKHKPKFNILLKDDKTYISLSINPKEEWPKLELTRFKIEQKQETFHFGPYTSTLAARQTFDLMSRLFPLRQCSNEEFKRRTRPCLLYDIKRCIAPCMQKCTKEEYTTYVTGAIDFLKGNSQKIIKSLEKEMHLAAGELEFEKAGHFLQTIKQIKHVTQTETIFEKSHGKEIDVIGLYREADTVLLSQLFFRQGKLLGQELFSFTQMFDEDEEILSSFILQQYSKDRGIPQEILIPIPLPHEKIILSILQEHHNSKSLKFYAPEKGDRKDLITLAQKNAESSFHQKKSRSESQEKLLLALQNELGLQRYPEKIECFDTSHLSGSHLVAASVSFINGEEERKNSKLYHIKGIEKPDDYAALHQVLTRRIIRAKKEESFPDLLMIDGGKGQLNIALQVLKEHEIIHIDVISLVKEKGRHDKGITLEKVFIPHKTAPISFPFHSSLLFFLQKVRDKAHEKAIGFYRKTSSKKTITSALAKIPGIGPIKQNRLLKQFGSLQNILTQPEEELKKVTGITSKDILELKALLKKQA